MLEAQHEGIRFTASSLAGSGREIATITGDPIPETRPKLALAMTRDRHIGQGRSRVFEDIPDEDIGRAMWQ